MIKRYEPAYRFLQLLWKPKTGDRVVFEGTKTHITKVGKDHECYLSNMDIVAMPYKLCYRPTPADALKVLAELPIYTYSHLTTNNRNVTVGVRCNKRTVHLKGNAFHVLNEILNLRVVDLAINHSINTVFERSNPSPQSGQGIRLRFIEGNDVGGTQ